MRSERIGVFGGSFDPPHHGHIHLLLSCIEQKNLTKVLIVPTKTQPLKKESASASDRFQMAKLAFQHFPFCEILDLEITREGPSYTVETLEWLWNHNPSFREAERFLLCGADLVPDFPKWKEEKSVFAMVKPLIVAREGVSTTNGEVVTLRRFDISSTEIRERVRRGLYIGHLVPKAIEGFITEKGLYLA